MRLNSSTGSSNKEVSVKVFGNEPSCLLFAKHGAQKPNTVRASEYQRNLDVMRRTNRGTCGGKGEKGGVVGVVTTLHCTFASLTFVLHSVQ